MREAQKDTQRVLAAARALYDGRDVSDAGVMVTLEGLVALVLLAHMGGNERKAAFMLVEGLVPGVESRMALHAARGARS